MAACPRHSKVVIDDLNLWRRPTHVSGTLCQLILPSRALLVLEDLTLRRLPDVDDRLQAQMSRLQLWAWPQSKIHQRLVAPALPVLGVEVAASAARSGTSPPARGLLEEVNSTPVGS